MPTLYKYNNKRIYTGSITVPEGISQENSTLIKPNESIKHPQWSGSGGGWIEAQPNVPTFLNITTNKEVYNLNDIVEISANVSSNNTLIQLTDTYYVPIMRNSDGLQLDFLAIDFINGEALASFIASEKGQFTIDVDKITPTPKAKLSNDISIIVI
jgi:hypothetical protein